jgi:NADPH2:quinone reductase
VRAIEAKTFSGYDGLQQIELAKPQPAKDKVLVRITAAGVAALDHTILTGGHPRAKAPLVLGNEGVGVVEDAGDSGLAVGTCVMFTGPYGVGENGAWQEWLLVRPEHLAPVPDGIDSVVAASIPVAYLTAQVTLTLAGFKPGMTVLAPGIGRSVGLAEGVRRITASKGVDIVIESIGGTVTGGALSSLGLGGVLITLGYSAGRETTIDLTDLIWKRARMAGFSLFAQSQTAIAAAWRVFLPLIVGGSLTSSPASRRPQGRGFLPRYA